MSENKATTRKSPDIVKSEIKKTARDNKDRLLPHLPTLPSRYTEDTDIS